VLIGWVEADGDMTMPELAAGLAEERQVVAHPASLSRYLRKAGYTVKKRCWRARPDARTWRWRGGRGGPIVSLGCAVIRTGWCSSTRPARRRR
jgi:transposase